MDEQQKSGWLIAKVASAWAAVGVTSWSEAASFLAAMYTMLLILHHVWKNWFRPFCVYRGWVKPLPVASGAGNADADA